MMMFAALECRLFHPFIRAIALKRSPLAKMRGGIEDRLVQRGNGVEERFINNISIVFCPYHRGQQWRIFPPACHH